MSDLQVLKESIKAGLPFPYLDSIFQEIYEVTEYYKNLILQEVAKGEWVEKEPWDTRLVKHRKFLLYLSKEELSDDDLKILREMATLGFNELEEYDDHYVFGVYIERGSWTTDLFFVELVAWLFTHGCVNDDDPDNFFKRIGDAILGYQFEFDTIYDPHFDSFIELAKKMKDKMIVRKSKFGPTILLFKVIDDEVLDMKDWDGTIRSNLFKWTEAIE